MMSVKYILITLSLALAKDGTLVVKEPRTYNIVQICKAVLPEIECEVRGARGVIYGPTFDLGEYAFSSPGVILRVRHSRKEVPDI